MASETASQKALREYLRKSHEIRSTGGGTDELPYYAPLSQLIDSVAKAIGMEVECVTDLANRGRGHPDGGLFRRARRRRKDAGINPGFPEYGAIEVKSHSKSVRDTAGGEQVGRYLEGYKIVLVTNLHRFLLLGNKGGETKELDEFSLTESEDAREAEDEFWKLASERKRDAVRDLGNKFESFLGRLFLHSAPLVRVQDVASVLAHYAYEALADLEENPPRGLTTLKRDLQQSLGMDLGALTEQSSGRTMSKNKEHFFLSMLVQALFYGMFSTWLDHVKGLGRRQGRGRFSWRESFFDLSLPVLRTIFHAIVNPDVTESNKIRQMLDRANEALLRVDAESFLHEFENTDAMQHFYEPFLSHFDPVSREKMGAWYTPHEIVEYMVERVDRILRDDLDIRDGLADENVYVLDPCCGTGAYVVEVLKRIQKTLREKGAQDLIGMEVKDAACRRIIGFELMAAPFVISHWRVNHLLGTLNAPVVGEERASIYLTNSLTGWEPPKQPPKGIPGLEEGALVAERRKADSAKRQEPVLVVIGNPPYSSFVGTSPDEEGELVTPYKKDLEDKWGIGKYNLDDLYVRFFRIAERLIAESERGEAFVDGKRRAAKRKKGIVCYISQHSYIKKQSFVTMRQHLQKSFDRIWIENLHGDRMQRERAPDGSSSNTVFHIPKVSDGIRQGIVIGTFLKTGESREKKVFRWRNDIDAGDAVVRRRQLLDSLQERDAAKFNAKYEEVRPQEWNWHLLRPVRSSQEYRSWPLLNRLCEINHINGPQEMYSNSAVAISQSALEERMSMYYDKDVTWETFKGLDSGIPRTSSSPSREKVRDPEEVRKGALANNEEYSPKKMVFYSYKPFDVRHAYADKNSSLWNAFRPEIWKYLQDGRGRFLVSRPYCHYPNEGPPVSYARAPWDYGAIEGTAKHIPFHRIEGDTPGGDSGANLSSRAKEYLSDLGFAEPGEERDALIWMHVLAVGFSPRYIRENAEALQIDWPRIPLPNDPERLRASANLGSRIATLMDPFVEGNPVASLDFIAERSGKNNFALTAGWGVGTTAVRYRKGCRKPGFWNDADEEALRRAFSSEGLEYEEGLRLLGQPQNIHLNSDTFWRGVPLAAWDYKIGGCPILNKWLAYREKAVMNREMTYDEVKEFSRIARRLTAIVLMGKALDENYAAAAGGSYDWGPCPPGAVIRG